jgi:hypothetical protein
VAREGSRIVTRARHHSTNARPACAVIALVLLSIGASGSGGTASAGGSAETLLRPASGVIGPLPRHRGCELTEYRGSSTPLYTDRPYHTAGDVPELSGLSFCRGKRHGQEMWILDVTRPTTLYTLASASHALERGGWRRLPRPVRVDAAGLALDRLYAWRIAPGRFAIHHGHATTANPVFFDAANARIAPIAAQGDD